MKIRGGGGRNLHFNIKSYIFVFLIISIKLQKKAFSIETRVKVFFFKILRGAQALPAPFLIDAQ